MTPLALDDRGVPRLLRASRVAPAPAATATESALTHVGRLSAAWGVADTALPKLQGIGEVPAVGATIARVRQSIDGLPVHGGELRVMVRDGGELVATNGVLVSADTPRRAAGFPIDDAQAIARAVGHNFKRPFDAASLAVKEHRVTGTRMIAGRHGDLDVQLARAWKAWQPTGTTLLPVWVVEAYAGDAHSTGGDAFRTVLTDDGARVISHHSLVSDAAFTYRVFVSPGDVQPNDGPTNDYSPHPTGMADLQFPGYAAPTMVNVDGLNHPAGQTLPDPWIPSTRTETFSNHVDVYTDANPPNGLTFGDFRATITGARTFDRTYDLNAGPITSQAQQMAAITNAFYGLNWLHDFWYDAGFTEAAGNAQDNNFGRGGEDRDAMLAETQDSSGTNNANMQTPSDGFPPRMQIYVWTGKEDRKLTIQPANRSPLVGQAAFGPSTFDTSAAMILGVDGTAPINDACEPLTNNVTGRLVVVDRNMCSLKLKALNVQNAGGAGMILINNVAGPYPPSMPNDTTITTPITIGSLSVTQAEGNQIKAELGTDAVSGVAHRAPTQQLDGALDATLLSHEYGHYVHHRLQDCNGTQSCGAQSEGWGDFMALMTMIRAGDNYDGAYPFSVYTTQNFTFDPAYFGIRRAPFSVNPAINSLSYRHMANGEALPTSHPFLVFSTNAEVHNAGEIWAQTMMEVYVALLKAPGATFAETRAKMAKYVVSGLLMSPQNSTPTETRDAIIAAAAPADRPIMMDAFARRGMGSCAISPSRDSTDFVGIVESTQVSGRAILGDLAYAEAESCDNDEILDAGETAMISLPIANQGHEPLMDVKVTLISPTPAITVKSGPATIASLATGASASIDFELALDKATTGVIAGDFKIKIEAANGCVQVIEVPLLVPLNADAIPDSSATDTFDAKSIWSASDTALWQQTPEAPLDRVWHGVDHEIQSDTKLESPAVTVAAAAPFKVTFTHRYAFEYSLFQGVFVAWDGGVIEYSTDNGATWSDVTTVPGVQPGYSHTLRTATDGNPIGGRLAYGNTNPSYPRTDRVTLDFGTNLAGMTVKLRFRIGSDHFVGGPGWDLDDVVFEGITGTPFPTLGEDRSADCGVTPPLPPLPPVDEQPGCCDAGPIRGGSLALMLGVLGILLRRRRR